MQDPKQTPPAAAPAGPDSIAAEHRHLKDLLGRVERTADLRSLVPMLVELREMLEKHFAGEEAPNGLHTTIGNSAPHHLTTLQNLFAEHGRFLEDLDRLVGDAEGLLEGPLGRLLTGVEELVGRLRRHEARETDLLGDAMFVDLGDSS